MAQLYGSIQYGPCPCQIVTHGCLPHESFANDIGETYSQFPILIAAFVRSTVSSFPVQSRCIITREKDIRLAAVGLLNNKCDGILARLVSDKYWCHIDRLNVHSHTILDHKLARSWRLVLVDQSTIPQSTIVSPALVAQAQADLSKASARLWNSTCSPETRPDRTGSEADGNISPVLSLCFFASVMTC